MTVQSLFESFSRPCSSLWPAPGQATSITPFLPLTITPDLQHEFMHSPKKNLQKNSQVVFSELAQKINLKTEKEPRECHNSLLFERASQVELVVKNLPAKWGETGDQVGSLGREDPLEEGMAAHSSVLACRIPWTEEPGGPQSIESQRVRHDWNNFSMDPFR